LWRFQKRPAIFFFNHQNRNSVAGLRVAFFHKLNKINIYKNGEKEALGDILAAISELEATNEPKFNKDVWMSGGYMRLAELLKDEDLAKAQEYLQKAKEIIDANPELVLRKGQWEKLAQNF